MGSQRVRHDSVTNTFTFHLKYKKKKKKKKQTHTKTDFYPYFNISPQFTSTLLSLQTSMCNPSAPRTPLLLDPTGVLFPTYSIFILAAMCALQHLVCRNPNVSDNVVIKCDQPVSPTSLEVIVGLRASP